MRVALIADIHGNLAALDAVLADLERAAPDRVICLGDVAATGPQPSESLERLRALGCPVVLGNTDAFLLHPELPESDDENARRVEEIDRWCAQRLTPTDLEYLANFQPMVEQPLDDTVSLLCFHGSPRSYDDKISATTPEAELEPMLDGRRASVLAGGHWHFQMLRRHEDMILMNPGSVGLVYELPPGGPPMVPARAEYALLNQADGGLSIDFRRVPYDRQATLRAMHERGMPHAEWWSSAWR